MSGETVSECSACGWRWPLVGPPPDGAECDNCGDDEWWESMTDDERDATYASAINGNADDFSHLDEDDAAKERT